MNCATAPRVLFALFLPALLVGCAVPTAMEEQFAGLRTAHPIQVKGSEPVAFHRATSSIAPGARIGSIYDGLARVRHGDLTWTNKLLDPDDVKNLANRELAALGYTVIGVGERLFGKDESESARFQLGAIIKEVKANVYGPLAGNFSEAMFKVEWQLFDKSKDKIVFTTSTEVYVKEDGRSPKVLLSAWRDSLRQLMGDEQFISILARK